MIKYQELFLQIPKFEDDDVITTSVGGDNVGGANGNWNGWNESTSAFED